MPTVARLSGVGTFLAYEFDEISDSKVSVSGMGTVFAYEFDENVGVAVTLTGSTRMRYLPTVGIGTTVVVFDSINEIDPFGDFPTEGLQVYFDSGISTSYSGSGTTWNDISGNGRNGTLTNGPTYSSSNGGIINLDGINQYVTISGYKGITGTSARTSIIWFKTSLPNISPRLFGWGNTTTGQKWNISLDATTYKLRAEIAGAAVLSGSTTKDLTDQTWHMVASSVPANGTANDIKIYIDGDIVTDFTVTNGTTAVNTASGSDVSFGASLADATPLYLNGSISQFLIYNRQLSDLEIKIIYRSILNRYYT